MSAEVKTTRLHDWHVANGANMGTFGNYSMPMWFPDGAKNEHLGVILKAGMFDTSHMGVLTISGELAFDLLQKTFTKDLNCCVGKNKEALKVGNCVYGLFLNDDGHVIDDAIVYKLDTSDFLIVVNAGMGAKLAGILKGKESERTIRIENLTDKLGKIDVQGPDSGKILSTIIKNPETVLKNFGYFNFKGHFNETAPLSDQARLMDGTPILLSRTGYTGEFGFEIFCDGDKSVHIWKLILEAGQGFGITPCGLASRDSLRAGAVLPLSHQDIGPWPFVNNPWSFALPFDNMNTNFTKDFRGAKALKEYNGAKRTYPFAGFDPRKIAPKGSVVLDETGRELGDVLTCVTDMAIGRNTDDKIYSVASPDKPDMKIKGLSCGLVMVDGELEVGTLVYLSDGKRKLKVEIREDVRPDRTARGPINKFL